MYGPSTDFYVGSDVRFQQHKENVYLLDCDGEFSRCTLTSSNHERSIGVGTLHKHLLCSTPGYIPYIPSENRKC